MLSLLSGTSGQSVMEFGCGAGFYSQELYRCYGPSLVLVDFSAEMLSKIQLSGVQKICADIETLEYAHNLDVIFCAGALEFVENTEQVFARMRDLLRETGEVVLMVPSSGLGGVLYKLFHRRNGVPIQLFNRTKIENLCRTHGFKIVEAQSAWPFSQGYRLGKNA